MRAKRLYLWLALLALIILVTVAAPLLSHADPLYAASGESLRRPSVDHLLGTDLIGRDVFSRLLYGGRQSLGSAALTTLLAVIPGTALGVLVGYYGGWADALIGVMIDALLAIPGLLTALLVVSVLGSGRGQIALAIGLAGLPPVVRVSRSAARSVRQQPYVEAARSLGARIPAILIRHILLNMLPVVASYAAVTFSWALLNGAALAFLGFTADPATPDWGVLLAAGRQVLPIAPWTAFAPGAALTITIFIVNRLADSLADQS